MVSEQRGTFPPRSCVADICSPGPSECASRRWSQPNELLHASFFRSLLPPRRRRPLSRRSPPREDHGPIAGAPRFLNQALTPAARRGQVSRAGAGKGEGMGRLKPEDVAIGRACQSAGAGGDDAIRSDRITPNGFAARDAEGQEAPRMCCYPYCCENITFVTHE